MRVHGDYYLPGGINSPEELRELFLEEPDLEKIWLDENPLFSEVCEEFGFHCETVRAITEVDLEKSEEVIWQEMDRKRRNTIRRAMKNGVTASLATESDIDEMLSVLVEGMCKKYDVSEQYIENLGKNVPNWVRKKVGYVAKYEGKIAAVTCVWESEFMEKGIIRYYSTNSSLPQYLSVSPNEFLIWEIMKHSKELGYKRFNMGGGNMFKRKFSKLPPRMVAEWIRIP